MATWIADKCRRLVGGKLQKMKRKKYKCAHGDCVYTCYVITRAANLEPFICLKKGLWVEFLEIKNICGGLPLYKCEVFCKNFSCLFATDKKEKKTSCVFAYGSGIKIKEIG